jgi:DNA repair protein RecO (recombination protein O)
MRVSLQPAWILHGCPYRDSSFLLEALTAEYGRISLVGRGARRRSRGGSGGALLQPFLPLLLSFAGRGELQNLTAVEAAGAAVSLRGDRLFSGLYVNELLVRLLHRHDAHPALFAAYGDTLSELAASGSAEGALRRFEVNLLGELGYRVDFSIDGGSGEAVREERWYHYAGDQGMVAQGEVREPSQPSYSGADLLLMANGEFEGAARLTAKRLLRQVLAGHLGGAPLKSRELFRRHSSSGGGGAAP